MADPVSVSIRVNGVEHELSVPANTLLVDIIREDLGLTGTHVGCDTSQRGACTLHLDGRAAKSCTVLAGQANGTDVVTVEGIGSIDNLHPMQSAFRDCHALQCGFARPA